MYVACLHSLNTHLCAGVRIYHHLIAAHLLIRHHVQMIQTQDYRIRTHGLFIIAADILPLGNGNTAETIRRRLLPLIYIILERLGEYFPGRKIDKTPSAQHRKRCEDVLQGSLVAHRLFPRIRPVKIIIIYAQKNRDIRPNAVKDFFQAITLVGKAIFLIAILVAADLIFISCQHIAAMPFLIKLADQCLHQFIVTADQ